jgi:hypothetical protein
MRQVRTTLLLGVIALLSVLLIWILFTPVPTTQEIDADLEQVRSEIKQASAEGEKYSPSLMKSLIEVRRQTLQNTEAMLSQKKASVLRRISLSYKIDGAQLLPVSDKELNDINEEIVQAERKLALSIKNAQQYSGGLVQVMALMTVETDQLSVSQLRLKFYSAKHGLPVLFPGADAAAKQPEPVPGRVVKDRDAL